LIAGRTFYLVFIWFCFRFYALFTYASYFAPKFNLLLDSDNILLTKQS
jgi:hypothetical protein